MDVDSSYTHTHTYSFYGDVSGGGWWREAELVHHPIGFGPFSGGATVVDEGLFQADDHRRLLEEE